MSFRPSTSPCRIVAIYRRTETLILESDLVQEAASATANCRLVVNYLQQAFPHLARLLASINGRPYASLLVVRNDWRGLRVVGAEALLEGLCVVIGALDERLAGHVILHLKLGRVKDLVIRAA